MKDDDELAGILVRRVKHVTTKAILCEVQGLELWIPKSQVHESWRWYRGMSGAMQVTYWWLEANELEHLAGADDAEPQRVAAGLTKAHRIYRQIAAKYHPDRSPDTQEFMKDINALWQAVLTDMKGR